MVKFYSNMAFGAMLLFLILSDYSASAQKVTAKSGRRPSFTKWSRGSDFKYVSAKKKIKGIPKGEKFLFVAEAVVESYRKENGRTYGFRAHEAVKEAEDNARIILAQTLNTYVRSVVNKSTEMDSLGRVDFFERMETISAKARFGGFFRMSSYYQREEVEGEPPMYHAWVLFYYEADKLREIIKQYAEMLDAPELAEPVTDAIETAADDADIENNVNTDL